jgi:4-hydroxy-3-polyprenylbenzoate decarboxylase
MNTIGRIHSGICDSLLLRSCSVALKERRRLVLVPRESPVSPISLQQMADLAKLGCDICMASPGFYAKPERIEDLVDFICLRVMGLIGVRGNGLRHVAANYLDGLATEERNGIAR